MRPPTRGTLILAACVLAAVGSTRVLRLNVSGSVAYGLYALRPVPVHLDHGTLVVLPVPRSVRAWHSRWLPLVKPIAALPGDQVCATDGVLWVAGVSYGPVLTASHGHPLPHIDDGCQVVPEGSLFLASPMVRSLDSRYYGAVSVIDIAAVAFPVVTWR